MTHFLTVLVSLVCLAWYTPALAARCLYVSSYHPGSVADSLVQGTAAAFQRF